MLRVGPMMVYLPILNGLQSLSLTGVAHTEVRGAEIEAGTWMVCDTFCKIGKRPKIDLNALMHLGS